MGEDTGNAGAEQERAMTQFRPLDLDEFLHLTRVVLIDCEFTCWEDTLRTNWSDPSRPPEVIEIGLVEYDLQRGEVGGTFASLVQPRLNRELSDYCKSLGGISQAAIDDAPVLVDVLLQIEAWLRNRELSGAPTCGFALADRLYLAREAQTHHCSSPFREGPHADMHALCKRVLGSGDRDAVRTSYGLAPNPSRHRALADALDVAQFCALLRRMANYGNDG
jgi:inhibitor of KinA sporulation pathway (predicted exonuclease)